MMRSGRVSWLARGLPLLVLVCTSAAASGEEGAATIEKLIEQCAAASGWADLLPMVHPDDRPMLGTTIQMMTAFAPLMAMPDEINSDNEAEVNALSERLAAEVEALEAKYGLKTPPEDAPAPDSPEAMAMQARYVFDGVDLAAYIAEAESWMAGVMKDAGVEDSPFPDFSTIENLQVEGDTATATVGGMPIEFAQKDGRWYIRVEEL